jgi:hypothetical protein
MIYLVTYGENIPSISNTLPIRFFQSESRPWYVLHRLAVVTNGCDRPITAVHRDNEQANSLWGVVACTVSQSDSVIVYLLTWWREYVQSSIAYAVPHRTLLCKEILSGVLMLHWTCSSLKCLIHILDAWICFCMSVIILMNGNNFGLNHTDLDG